MSYGRDDTGHLGLSDGAYRDELTAQRKFRMACTQMKADPFLAISYLSEAEQFSSVMGSAIRELRQEVSDAVEEKDSPTPPDVEAFIKSWDEKIEIERKGG